MKTAILIVVLMCAIVSGGQRVQTFNMTHCEINKNGVMVEAAGKECREHLIAEGVAVPAPAENALRSATGHIESLSAAEYNRLESLRKQLRDAEVEIAKAHGVKTEIVSHDCLLTPFGDGCEHPDNWEIRGGWLLVNVPEEGR